MRKSRKLGVENLENRALLAGNVSVSVEGSVLKIVGDGQANGVSVQQLDQNKFFVTGFALYGTPTTINGQATGRIVQGVRHIDADLNAGYDVFILSNSNFRQNELAQDLSGGNAGPVPVSPEAPNPATAHPVTARVFGNVSVKMDDGNDGVGIGARIGTLDSNGNIVNGFLYVNGANGRDQVNVDRSTAFDDMLFEMGSGNDTVQANVARVGDFLFANLGDGEDRFVSENAHGWHSHILGGNHNDVVDIRDYRMEQEILVNTGDGHDRIYAAGISGVSLELITGEGNDRVGVDGASSRGGAVVDTAGGNDFVRLNGVFVANHAAVIQGAGDDTLRVANSTADSAVLNGGVGFDRLFDDGGNNFGDLDTFGYEQTF
jgi:hypothetical protein